MIIQETFILGADSEDVLKAPSRLAAIPFNGTLVIEISTSAATTANNGSLTIQLPDGEVPVDHVVIPAVQTSGSLDDRDKTMYVFPARQGGHFGLDWDQTGNAVGIMRVTLST